MATALHVAGGEGGRTTPRLDSRTMSGDPAIEYLRRRVGELEERVARLEQGATGTADGAATAATDDTEPSAYVRELVASGNTIQAIHEYRKESGLGLKDAKRRIESLSR